MLRIHPTRLPLPTGLANATSPTPAVSAPLLSSVLIHAAVVSAMLPAGDETRVISLFAVMAAWTVPTSSGSPSAESTNSETCESSPPPRIRAAEKLRARHPHQEALLHSPHTSSLDLAFGQTQQRRSSVRGSTLLNGRVTSRTAGRGGCRSAHRQLRRRRGLPRSRVCVRRRGGQRLRGCSRAHRPRRAR